MLFNSNRFNNVLDGIGSTGNGSNLCQLSDSDSGSTNRQWQVR
jgi:hypothetical protein